MLASRGGVYSERGGRFEAHDGCSCSVEPLWERQPDPPEVKALQADWRQATSGLSGREAIAAWRRFWDAKKAAAVPERVKVDLEEAARLRQATIDAARKNGAFPAELAEIVANEATGTALRARVGAAVTRGAIPADVAEAMLAALNAGDRTEMLALGWRHAAKFGVTPVDVAGQETRFIRKRHQPIAGSIPDGAPVTVVRPGLRWRAGDEDIIIVRAVVID
jgi:hypothetical protein